MPAPRQVSGIPAHAGQVTALEQPLGGGGFGGEIGVGERLAFGRGRITGVPTAHLAMGCAFDGEALHGPRWGGIPNYLAACANRQSETAM